MNYSVITPEFYSELVNKDDPAKSKAEYLIITSPAAIEYVFPLNNPEVVRTLISIENPVNFKMAELAPELRGEYEQKALEMVKGTPVLYHYWAVKAVTMNALQNRKYSLDQRMLLMNFAYKSVQGMLDKNALKVIPQFVNDFMKTPEHDDIIKYFEKVKPNLAFSLCDGISFLRALSDNEESKAVLNKVFENTKIDISSPEFKFDEKIYLPMRKAYSENFEKNRAHYMEQVVVNYVWTFCMPFADYHMDLWQNFIFFNTIYNALKVLIACYTYNAENIDEAFVEAVVAFDKGLRSVKGNMVKTVVDVNLKQQVNNNGDMASLSLS